MTENTSDSPIILLREKRNTQFCWELAVKGEKMSDSCVNLLTEEKNSRLSSEL